MVSTKYRTLIENNATQRTLLDFLFQNIGVASIQYTLHIYFSQAWHVYSMISIFILASCGMYIYSIFTIHIHLGLVWHVYSIHPYSSQLGVACIQYTSQLGVACIQYLYNQCLSYLIKVIQKRVIVINKKLCQLGWCAVKKTNEWTLFTII